MTGFDSALDALFKSSAGASQASVTPAVATTSSSPEKRKREKTVSFAEQFKRRRPCNRESETNGRAAATQNLAGEPTRQSDHPTPEDIGRPHLLPRSETRRTKPGRESDSDSDSDAIPPIHESVRMTETPVRKEKHFVPLGETAEQRDARTIFVGNLPATAANNSNKKALHKHILSHLVSANPSLPKPKIESSRFRSIAFKKPTSKLPSDALSSQPKPSSDHDRTRTAAWRATQQSQDGPSDKVYQTPAQKKKTAYITGAVHESASGSCSAYVVFAHPRPAEGTDPEWDPTEVAARAVEACNGTTFMDRTLRVDQLKKGKETVQSEPKLDARTMVFVGNLDFEVQEDAVEALFESLVEKERGGDNERSDGEGDDDKSDGTDKDESWGTEENGGRAKLDMAEATVGCRWVKSVRIVRDKDTRLGKGFAYVQFYDRTSADEVLAMEPGTIKLAKRKLRVQRCKTLPGATIVKPSQKATSSSHSRSGPVKSARSPIPDFLSQTQSTISRADPALGERIRSLSKAERKVVKSADADRVARRLAKKRARIVMEKSARTTEWRKTKEKLLRGREGRVKRPDLTPSKKPEANRSVTATRVNR